MFEKMKIVIRFKMIHNIRKRNSPIDSQSTIHNFSCGQTTIWSLNRPNVFSIKTINQWGHSLCVWGWCLTSHPAEGWIRLVCGWVYHLAGLACLSCGFYVYTTNSNRMPSTQNMQQLLLLLLLLFSEHRATYLQYCKNHELNERNPLGVAYIH